MPLPLRALLPALSAALVVASPARAADDCELRWQLSAKLDAAPPHVAATVSFAAGGRERSTLDLPPVAGAAGWRTTQPGQSVEGVPGQPRLLLVRHPPQERVVVEYRIDAPTVPAGRPGGVVAERWLLLFGDTWAALPVDEVGATSRRLCVEFGGLPDGAWWLGSFGAQRGRGAAFRVDGAPAALREAVVVGGDLQVAERGPSDRPLRVAAPAQAAVDVGALAARAARFVETAQRFWRDAAAPAPLIVVEPGAPAAPRAEATSARQALVVRIVEPGQPGTDTDEVLARALLHTWIPDRFGPSGYAGRDDAAQRAWFGDGFAEHYAHRLLLGGGLWTLGDYAAALNANIARSASPRSAADEAALRGEWLALRWHAALRERGHPGLDTVMRSLLLPPAQARREGPLSKPLVVHRLLAALRPWLGELPLADLHAVVDDARPLEFDAHTLGPCFGLAPRATADEAAIYRPLPDALRQPACRDWTAIGTEVDAQVASLRGPRSTARTMRVGKAGAPTKAGKSAKAAKGGKASKSAAGRTKGRAAQAAGPSKQRAGKPR